MNYLNYLALILVTYVTVFVTSWQTGVRDLLGVQIDLLPGLMVYCGLSTGWLASSLVSILGGLWFDSLSANPLGISVAPLFLIGFVVRQSRDLILRDERYAQFVLGASASVVSPVFTLLLLLGTGHRPLFGWGSFWQWSWMALIGGAFTPVFFWLFGRLNNAFNYQPLPESSFRPDREIKRGRV